MKCSSRLLFFTSKGVFLYQYVNFHINAYLHFACDKTIAVVIQRRVIKYFMSFFQPHYLALMYCVNDLQKTYTMKFKN